MLIRRFYSIYKNTFADMDNLIAVVQMTSTANKEINFQKCKTLITNAHKCGAKVCISLRIVMSLINSEKILTIKVYT